jgi:hypothetical protein
MQTHDGIRPVSAEGVRSATGEDTGHHGAKPVRFFAKQKTGSFSSSIFR